MENKGIYYPDSVDANFHVPVYFVRESSNLRCSIPSVRLKNEIEVPLIGKRATGFDSVLLRIASRGPSSIATLPETRLCEISTTATRPIMDAVSRIFQRLSDFECILPPQQVDIFAAILE